ncbi:MAG TPA: hypothetical protein VN931_04395 [Fibrobacteria bacterium]|nr:hypothetical protein [Fibrobacteria bacterium]
MISRCETWSSVALSTATLPEITMAKGWASLMSAYDIPEHIAKASDSIPTAIHDTESSAAKGPTAQ